MAIGRFDTLEGAEVRAVEIRDWSCYMTSKALLTAVNTTIRSPKCLSGRIKRALVRNRFVSDRKAIEIQFETVLGYRPDLDNPKTFNEKLQWLKLHDRNPEYTIMVDKYRAKQWVADRIGWEHIVPTYAKWDHAEDITIDDLPDQFVLKTNHDQGGVVICRDKSSFDLKAAKKKLSRHLKRNLFWYGREWPYLNVKPLVFAEQYLQSPADDLADYKLFRFNNGRLITLYMTDRFTEAGLTETFFDEEWHRLDVTENGHSLKADAPKPKHFEEMKCLAEAIAEDLPFLRVDYYESSGKLYFGELTLYPNSGLEQFDPADWDLRLGSWIVLPVRGGGAPRE